MLSFPMIQYQLTIGSRPAVELSVNVTALPAQLKEVSLNPGTGKGFTINVSVGKDIVESMVQELLSVIPIIV